MKKLLLTLLFLLMPSMAIAAPAITSLSGTYEDNNSITIVGTGLGTNDSPQPIFFHDFENGTNGNDLDTVAPNIGSTWTFLVSGTSTYYPINPKFSNVEVYNGSLSARCTFWSAGSEYDGWQTQCGFGGNDIMNSDDFYLFYHHYYDSNDTENDYQSNKEFYVFGSVNDIGGVPQFLYQAPNAGNDTGAINVYDNSGGDGAHVWDGNSMSYYRNKWRTYEIYGKLNSDGTGNGSDDGIVWNVLDGSTVMNSTTYTYRAEYSAHPCAEGIWQDVRIGFINAGANRVTYHYYDDVYFDDKPQHIMLCENADGSGHREIQVCTAWNDNGATFTFRAGSFSVGTTVYPAIWTDYNTYDVYTTGIIIGGSGEGDPPITPSPAQSQPAGKLSVRFPG